MAKTLVTGATGFIGSHVAHALAARGDELRVTLRKSSREEALGGLDCERARCDLLDRRAVRRALDGVDRVFHVAGLTSLRPRDEELVFRLNVDATRILMEECLRAGVERVVYTSSVAAIGPAPPGQRADETQIFTGGRLRIPYVDSKHEAELEALRVGARGLPLVCVNPTIVYGYGDLNATSTSVVRRLLLGRIPAYVDGGVNIVDVRDVAAGQLLADQVGVAGERYILGGRNYTLRRLFADLGRVAGVEPPPLRLGVDVAVPLARLAERLPGPAPTTVSEARSAGQWWTYSSAKAKRELGWSTRPHEETLEATVRFWVEREGRRIVRSQPPQVKAAARAADGLGATVALARRLVRR